MKSERIEIHVGRQLDGCTFRLHPHSKALIKAKYPEVKPPSSLFVSYEDQQNPEQIYWSMWWQIAMILTGLSENEIKEQYEIAIVDPVNGKEIFNSHKQGVNA